MNSSWYKIVSVKIDKTGSYMSSFFEDLKEWGASSGDCSSVVKYAKENGADECEVSVGGVKGLSVSSRDMEVEHRI